MATIQVTFDTLEKTLAVTRDGTEVPNVCGVYIGRAYNDPDLDEDDFRLEVMQQSADTDNDLCQYTRLVASESGAGRQLTAAGEVEATPGFVVAAEIVESSLQQDVLDYLGRKG